VAEHARYDNVQLSRAHFRALTLFATPRWQHGEHHCDVVAPRSLRRGGRAPSVPGEGGHPARHQLRLVQGDSCGIPADHAIRNRTGDARMLLCVCGERSAADHCATSRIALGGSLQQRPPIWCPIRL